MARLPQMARRWLAGRSWPKSATVPPGFVTPSQSCSERAATQRRRVCETQCPESGPGGSEGAVVRPGRSRVLTAGEARQQRRLWPSDGWCKYSVGRPRVTLQSKGMAKGSVRGIASIRETDAGVLSALPRAKLRSFPIATDPYWDMGRTWRPCQRSPQPAQIGATTPPQKCWALPVRCSMPCPRSRVILNESEGSRLPAMAWPGAGMPPPSA
jgi:hypothetical protein